MLSFETKMDNFEKDVKKWKDLNSQQFPKELQEKLKTLDSLNELLRSQVDKDARLKTSKLISDLLNSFSYMGCTPVYVHHGYYMTPSAQMSLQRLPVFRNVYLEDTHSDPTNDQEMADYFDKAIVPQMINDFDDYRDTDFTPQFRSQLKADAKTFKPQNLQANKGPAVQTQKIESLYSELRKSR